MKVGSAAQAAYQLACTEVWGGNRNVSALVDLPGMRAWVDSHPFQGIGGGDLHYLSACNNGVVARVALADVSGHGEAVSGVAEKLRDLMRQYVNYWDQSDFMRGLNDAFPKDRGGLKYASAAILGLYTGSGEVVMTNAGHPPPLWYRATGGKWELMVEDSPSAKGAVEGLPLGLIPGTDYRQTAFQLTQGDLVVLYTDGITESRDAQGREMGSHGFQELAASVCTQNPAAAGGALLAAVNKFRNGAAPSDDETLVVLQRL
jgi:sigma-B regulation protein RsbU (phosphoserine phosphatase)